MKTVLLFVLSFNASPKAFVEPVVTAKVAVPYVGIVQPPPVINAFTLQPVNVSSAPLDPEADNKATIQAFLDSLLDGAEVEFPAGIWPISDRVKVNKRMTIKSPDGAIAGLRSTSNENHAAVLQIGSYGNPSTKVSGVVLKRMTFILESPGTNNLQNCIVAYGDNIRFEKCLWMGAAHEGVVVHGDSQMPYFLDCTGRRCGRGNGYYGQTTAVYNSHADDTTYEGCIAEDSGQGIEMGGTRIRALRCKIYNCDKAFNVGSHGRGVSQCEVAYCTAVFFHHDSSGGHEGVVFGNGIGRFDGLYVHHNTFINYTVVGMGGKENNNIPWSGEGPPSGTTRIEDNVFHIPSKTHAGIIGYKVDGGAEFGRENFSIKRNRIYFDQPIAEVNTPTIFVQGGPITGSIAVEGNEIYGTDVAPTRGDFQTFSLAGATLNLSTANNKAFKVDRTERPFIANLE